MRETWSRRGLLGFGVTGAAILAAPVWARDGNDSPHGGMHLSRRLTRSLSDGARISVFRRWKISISRQGIGWAVQGGQIAVDVEAPEHIAAIADIERRRSTDAKFPIFLGSAGEILAAGGDESEADIDLAVREAERMIADAPLSAQSKQQRQLLLGQLQNAGNSMLERLPKDLFYPQSISDHQTRQISLPDGSVGEFELVLAASVDDRTGLMQHMNRTITTRLHSSEEHSSEHWKLRPA